MRKIWEPVGVFQEAIDAKPGSQKKNRVRIGLSQLHMKQAQSSSPGMEGAGLGRKCMCAVRMAKEVDVERILFSHGCSLSSWPGACPEEC